MVFPSFSWTDSSRRQLQICCNDTSAAACRIKREMKAVSKHPAPAAAMKSVRLPAGERLPALGQGTWGLGENPARREEEIATLQLGLDLGATLIDTAEMYGNGRTEELVGA